jgi:hypothetical protein
MNWEQRFCSNQACGDWAWMVLRDPTLREVWWVAAHSDDRPFTIAAPDPICPHCGTTLVALVAVKADSIRSLALR